MPIKSRTETTTGEWLGPTSEEKICNSVPMPSSGCKLSFPLANRSGNKSTLTSPVRIKPTILVFWLGSRHSSKDRRESGWTTVLGSTWLVWPEFQSIPGIGFFICAGSYILSRELELVTDKTDSNRWRADCCWAGHWSLNEEISRLIGAKLYVRSEPLSVIESNNPCANFIVRPVCIPTNRDTKMSVSALGPEKAPWATVRLGLVVERIDFPEDLRPNRV